MNKKIMIKKSQNHYPCDFPRTDEKISRGGGMRPILECQGRNKEKSLGTTDLDDDTSIYQGFYVQPNDLL